MDEHITSQWTTWIHAGSSMTSQYGPYHNDIEIYLKLNFVINIPLNEWVESSGGTQIIKFFSNLFTRCNTKYRGSEQYAM